MSAEPVLLSSIRVKPASVTALFIASAPRLASPGTASAAFATRALEQTGVVVLPGSAFGPAGEGFFRIALTVGADRLRAAAGRLGQALEATRRGELASAT